MKSLVVEILNEVHVLLGACVAAGCLFAGQRADSAEVWATSPPDGFQFEGNISREVLQNYLSRSITMEGMLNGRGDLNDNIRMLKSAGAKYVGRALCLWGAEADYPSPAVPTGLSDEEAIRAAWAADLAKPAAATPASSK